MIDPLLLVCFLVLSAAYLIIRQFYPRFPLLHDFRSFFSSLLICDLSLISSLWWSQVHQVRFLDSNFLNFQFYLTFQLVIIILRLSQFHYRALCFRFHLRTQDLLRLAWIAMNVPSHLVDRVIKNLMSLRVSPLLVQRQNKALETKSQLLSMSKQTSTGFQTSPGFQAL